MTTAVLEYLSAIPIGFVSQNLEALKSAVRSGSGIGCLSRIAVEREIAEGELCELRLRELRFSRKFCIITRKALYQGELQSALSRFAVEWLKARQSVTRPRRAPSDRRRRAAAKEASAATGPMTKRKKR